MELPDIAAKEMCEVVEEVNPEVVSFHFGLPTPDLMDRSRSAVSGFCLRRRV